jgi:hemoglobin/transferrin/lactoferrin receptor protein
VAFDRADVVQAGDSLTFKATLFNNDLENLIGTTPRVRGGPAVPFFSNVAEARIWGGELEGAYDSDRFFASVAYSNVRSRDRATGRTLADTPAENVALTLGTRFPDMGLEVSWRGSWYDGITTSSTATSGPAYDVHDLFVTWEPTLGVLDGFEVNLAVENVFDTTYRNNLAQDNGLGRNYKITLARGFEW